MKTQLLRTLYRLVAFLADNTKGFRLFAQWKVALGSLLIGVTLTTSCKQKTACYEVAPVDDMNKDTVTEIAAPQNPKNDTLAHKPKRIMSTIDVIDIPPDDGPSCYVVISTETPNPDTTINYNYTTSAEVMPSFPGGEERMWEFIKTNLQYPQEAKKNGVEGKVRISFVVQNNGEITDAKILTDIGYGCGLEALRIIKMMPKWVAGMQNGEKIPVRLFLYIKFELPK